jgi:hypothetical protein
LKHFRVEGQLANGDQVWAHDEKNGEIRFRSGYKTAGIYAEPDAELILRNFPCAKKKVAAMKPGAQQ